MKKIIILFVFGLLIQTNSFAQESSDYEKELKKMFEVSGSDQVYKSAVAQMINQFKVGYSDIPDEFWEEMKTEMLTVSIDDLTKKMVPIYSKYFSKSELKTLIAFYKTPIGKKLAESSPMIVQESMVVGQEWGKELGEKIVAKISERNN